MGMFYYDNELYHYGVKGMKWGVRTSVYTKNRIGDNYTDRQKKKMSSAAVRILKKERNWDSIYAKGYQNSANRADKRANKHAIDSEKARAKGDIDGSQNYQNKAQKQVAKQQQLLEAARQHTEKAELASKRINDIESGKLKAGRDFVTNSVYSTNLLLDAAGILNVSRVRTVEFDSKPTQSTDKNAKESTITYKQYASGTVTNVNKALASKTPYYALSEKEKNSIDRSYEDRRAALRKQRDNAKTPEQKQKILDQIDELELDYLSIVERDW